MKAFSSDNHTDKWCLTRETPPGSEYLSCNGGGEDHDPGSGNGDLEFGEESERERRTEVGVALGNGESRSCLLTERREGLESSEARSLGNRPKLLRYIRGTPAAVVFSTTLTTSHWTSNL